MIEWNCPCGNSYKFHGFTKTEAQEPVVWRFYDGKMWCYVNHLTDLPQSKFEPLYTTPPQRTEQEQQIETLKRCLFQMQEAAKDLVEQAKSLPPPQRTWVDLTDEQMWNAYTGGSDIINLDYAKSILELFKEKNSA